MLDRQRLGKQRVETMQILQALLIGRGYINHPAVAMWAGYEQSLLRYQDAICHEWVDIRGYRDTCWEKTHELYDMHSPMVGSRDVDPPWLGSRRFHEGHQSNLLRKNPTYYGPIFPDVPDDLEYVWPV